MRFIFDILGVIFFLLIIQAVRAYMTTRENECRELGINYFPLNTVQICRGTRSSIVTNTGTPTTTETPASV